MGTLGRPDRASLPETIPTGQDRDTMTGQDTGQDPMTAEILTGAEVTDGAGRRGVVVDGHVARTGPNRGKLVVMWIGGRYPVGEWPHLVRKVDAK
jgi:hypothetical protein